MHSTLLKTGINYRGNRDRKIYFCINGCFKEAKKKRSASCEILGEITFIESQESLGYTNSYCKFDKILLT